MVLITINYKNVIFLIKFQKDKNFKSILKRFCENIKLKNQYTIIY